ncbi:hypothetical protein QBC43DRAFT_213706, partial [Cladorrhinum sp. PSN259]
TTTILRGFKVSPSVFDAFLKANKVDETYGFPPFYKKHPDKDAISRLLYAKVSAVDPNADRARFRILVPSFPGTPDECSDTIYIPYAWAAVRLQRELNLDEYLPNEVPRGFEELRKEILGFAETVRTKDKIAPEEEGKLGVYMLVTWGIRGEMPRGCPLGIAKRNEACGDRKDSGSF